jgi:hypothetical protein
MGQASNYVVENMVVERPDKCLMAGVAKDSAESLGGCSWQKSPLATVPLERLRFEAMKPLMYIQRPQSLCVHLTSMHETIVFCLFVCLLQTMIFDALRQRGEVTLIGDMQYTSVGHSSTYGVYTLMDYTTGYVIITEVLDRRETGGSSPTLELYGLLRCLYQLAQQGIKVKILVTDENCQIKKFFSKSEGVD